MTETARRLRRLGAPHARARAFAMVLGGFGAALAAAALGLALAPAVPGIALAWALILVSAAAATWAVRRTRRQHRRRRQPHRGAGQRLERGVVARGRYARCRRRLLCRATGR